MTSLPRPFRTRQPTGSATEACADPRAGTRVALGLPLAALAALAVWLAGGAPQPELSPWAFIVLPLVCAAYGLLPLSVDARTYFTFDGPTVLLAGLVGGPLAGVLAGVATGLGDVNAVWRRRSAYAGLAMLQGFTAGLAGNGWRDGALPLVGAVALSGLAYLALGAVGLALVMADRRTWSLERLVRAWSLDVGEYLVAAPLLVVLTRTFVESPALASLAAVSGFGVAAFGAWRVAAERALVEREREARLTDPVTGALSRSAFEEALAREHARVLRGERPAGLVVCDLDRFAVLNERYGHLGGDRILRWVVDRLREETRAGEVLARWGGDELCLIAPGVATLAELEAVCERIRRSVADARFSIEGEEVPVTISVGATLLTDARTPDQTFARADEALYVAKRRRNAVCVLAPLSAHRTTLGRLATSS
jgi:diguanylate cyclase (GGDEF)-like protein